MEKLIACCGLNCATCDARIATVNNDDELRAKTAKAWSVHYNVPNLPIEAINCTGCRIEGVKLGHCSECGVRNCVNSKGYETCNECDQLENCTIVGPILKFVPEALQNLRSLS
jgi:hypothetical protein